MSAKLVTKRTSLTNGLCRLAKFANSIDEHTTKTELKIKLTTLEDYWSRFFDIQLAIEEVSGDAEIEFQRIEMDTAEDTYHQAKIQIISRMDELNVEDNLVVGDGNAAVVANNLNTSTSRMSVKLPNLEIAKFNGDFTMWTSFNDIFTSAIGQRENLSGSQKLHYLKMYLDGEAAQLVRPYQVTDANFTVAWAALNNRYNNIRRLVNAQFRKLFGQSRIETESPAAIRKLIDTTTECIEALHALELPTDHWDSIMVNLIEDKLDSETHKQWELSLEHNNLPTYNELVNFMEKRCRSLEAIELPSTSKLFSKRGNTPKINNSRTMLHTTAGSKCGVCSGDHLIYTCPEFLKLSISERTKMVMSRKLCFNCLRTQHNSSSCKSTSTCRTCGRKHHTLIHFSTSLNEKSVTPVISPLQETSPSTSQIASHVGQNYTEHQILLSTACVKIAVAVGGAYEMVRVLLDSGSQATFISEECAQRLRLKRKAVSIPVNGLGATTAGYAHSMVKLQLQSCVNKFVFEVNALVLKTITGVLPNKEISLRNLPKYNDITLADPEYYKPGKIEMLIGSDVLGKLLIDGIIPGDERRPTAQNTELGWVLSGPITSSYTHCTTFDNNIGTTSLHLKAELDLQRFWEVEEFAIESKLTEAESQCEEHFKNSYCRDTTGRFVVRIPFIDTPTNMGDSRQAAVRRLVQIEKKINANLDVKLQYTSFLEEYLELGRMQRVKYHSNYKNQQSYYLPHHFVLKESSSTTKLRVVFDGSCKSTSGKSINHYQLIGPRLQDELFAIVLRFRQHAIAITSDITKMYRQVQVHPDDWSFQRIVWRNKPCDAIQEWNLKTVTYGMASAPYLAIRCLRQLAEDEAVDFPEAAKIVLSDFYVDDLISGCDDEEAAIKLYKSITALLGRGGFELRKWSSNSQMVRNSIPTEKQELKVPLNLSDDECMYVKTLGIHWHPQSDTFGFKVNVITNAEPVTKRQILATVAKLFDPLGFLSPTIIVAKILLQRLWSLGIEWDQEVPLSVMQPWTKFRDDLPNLEKIKIPRWLGTKLNHDLQIHAFCDASEVAYGAVIYARSIWSDGTVHIQLITAKTRVAPIKQLSVPNLELCAATLLAKLLSYVFKTLRIDTSEYFAWSDSSTVLSWLQKPPRQWKTFVANRVSYIQSKTEINKWRYVPSISNPADCSSRGIMPTDLVDHHLWFTGPPWLQLHENYWPKKLESSSFNTKLEERPNLVAFTNIVVADWELIEKYSTLTKLKRVTAYVMRFVNNAKGKSTVRRIGPLSTSELNEALVYWLKQNQASEFAVELECAQQNKELPRNSRLLTLNPFLDELGLIRVGGRLKNSKINYNQMHPIILSPANIFTKLIVADIHIKLLHGGIQSMLGYLRRSYWLISGRNYIRKHIHKCIVCCRQNPKMCEQKMGNLPQGRIVPSRPFSTSGVDYAGPLYLKSATGRGSKTIKGYICLFVCFVTKAVHLELASDMTTDAFLAAFRRFVSRRGKCTHLYSDRGTNFVGAQGELRDLKRILGSKSHNELVSSSLANDGTSWHMIPAGSPHFGGLWEAGVKSVKFHLRRVVGLQKLTFEEMTTSLAEIEACLNSRPLCAQSDDVDDLVALTPGHFLIGESLMVTPEVDLTRVNPNRLTHWKLIQQMTQHFWYRWNSEYLHALQQRPKWKKSSPNVTVGQLVIVKDERLPPTKWLMARIISVSPGDDDRVRVATLKYAGGTTTRTINKLCILPVE